MDRLENEIAEQLGSARVGSLHLNDSQTPLGANRDRHANIGKLACVLETPGKDRSGPSKREVALAVRLHKRGVAERA
jgi:hypothetical protein